VSQTNSPAAQVALSSQASASRPRWLSVLLLLVVAALIFRLIHDRAAHGKDPLRGNLEETPLALEDALERMPNASRLPLLLTYAHDPCPALRYAALDQLSNRPSRQVADLLEQAFLDSDSKVRELAIQQLVGIDPKRGRHLLLCALHDDDTWIREAAILQIKALLQQKRAGIDRTIVPNLIASLDDPDEDVVQTAMTVLRKLTGQSWYVRLRVSPAVRRSAIDHWKQWWSVAQTHWPVDPSLASAVPLAPTRADPCPDFALYSLDGHTISRQGQRNRITLLNFWDRSCGPCIAEAPTLVEVDQRYRDLQVDVIGIHAGQGDNSEAQEINAIRDWCRKRGVTYTQTLASSAVREDFGDIHDVPVSVLLDRQGRIRYRWEGGPREPEVFSAAIQHLLRE